MPRSMLIVSLCLVLSVGLNVYLLWPATTTAVKQQPTVARVETQPTLQQEKSTGIVADNAKQTYRMHQSEPAATNIDTARQWLNNGEYAKVERFLIDTLRAHPDSAELLLLEADYILATEPLSTAVAHFYALQELGLFSNAQREALRARTDDLVENTIKALYNAGDWDVLAQFLEPLFQLDSTDKNLTLKLAEAYARQQKFTLMEDVLANISRNDAGARSIRQRFLPSDSDSTNSNQPSSAPAEQQTATRLALTRYGDQYIANVDILNRPAALLLDTGASSTAISKELYLSLKRFNHVQVMGLFDVRTAGGPIRSPLVRIDRMTLGPFTLKNIGVFVMPDDALLQADGLLGMNVLKQFHFQLDQTTAELLLTPRDNTEG